MSWFSDTFGGGDDEESSSTTESSRPAYQASQYDAPMAANLNNWFTPRLQGKNLGYSAEDMGQMTGQAIDLSTRAGNEQKRISQAGRKTSGQTLTGGSLRANDQIDRGTSEYRSNAIRDIAVRNAVQKKVDEQFAVGGAQNFLNSERQNAMSIWTGNMTGYQLDQNKALQDWYTNNYNQGQEGQEQGNWWDTILNTANLFTANKGEGT